MEIALLIMQVSSEAKLENILGSPNPLKMLIMIYHIKVAILKQCAILTKSIRTMVCMLNLASCLFFALLQAMYESYISKWLKKIFVMYENYEIQISMSINKVLLEQRFIHFCMAYGCVLPTTTKLSCYDRNHMTCKA